MRARQGRPLHPYRPLANIHSSRSLHLNKAVNRPNSSVDFPNNHLLLAKVPHASNNTITFLNTTLHQTSALVLPVDPKDFLPMDILLCHTAHLHLVGTLHQGKVFHIQILVMSMEVRGNSGPQASRRYSKDHPQSQLLLLRHPMTPHKLLQPKTLLWRSQPRPLSFPAHLQLQLLLLQFKMAHLHQLSQSPM